MKRFKNLSYFRVAACIAVVCTHLGQRIQLTGRPYEITHYMQHAVYLFFIISGFLALYTYSGEHYRAWRYWVRRLARILPVYYAIIIYNIIVHTFIFRDMPPDESGLGWLRYIFLINQYIPGDDKWRNLSFTWTIGIFVLFYLLTPLLARLIKTYRAALAGLLLTYIAVVGLENVYAYFEIDREWFTPLFYIIYFMFGVVACRAVQENKTDRAALLFAVLMLYFFAVSRFNSPYTLACLLTIMILSSMKLEFGSARVQKVFDVLDRYSYEIYLGHAVVIELIDVIITPAELPAIVTVVAGIAGTAVVSLLLYYGVDRPVNRLIKDRI